MNILINYPSIEHSALFPLDSRLRGNDKRRTVLFIFGLSYKICRRVFFKNILLDLDFRNNAIDNKKFFIAKFLQDIIDCRHLFWLVAHNPNAQALEVFGF